MKRVFIALMLFIGMSLSLAAQDNLYHFYRSPEAPKGSILTEKWKDEIQAQRVKDGIEEMYEHWYDIYDGGDNGFLDAGGGAYKVSTSSTLPAQGANLYDAHQLLDGRLDTPWVEGKSDYGIGEKITLFVRNDSPRIYGIFIYNGYSKSPTAWQNNSRVKTMKIYINGKPYGILHLEDIYQEQYFYLNPKGWDYEYTKDGFGIGNFPAKECKTDPRLELYTQCVEYKTQLYYTITLEILEVYKGKKYADTAISEIGFYGEYACY